MLKLFNTLGRKKQTFKPIEKGQVSMYTCGPTVYQFAHIGNLMAYLAEDILRRTLEYNGYHVKQVMNITDVGHLTSDADTGEDKVEQEAKKEHKKAKEITKFYAKQFFRDLKQLNIEPPVKFAWASQYIKEQIALIQRLEKKGYTYVTSDGVYFDTAKFKSYGKLGSLSAGKARVVHSQEKRRATDFALWKFSLGEKRQQEWKSPWGIGFPGWHIECSAISSTELGQPFDIHTGGEDHIAVHHNDEIAQSEAAYGKPLAHYWLHNAFMVVHGAKISKSAGIFYTLNDLMSQGIDPMVFRYLVVSSHYRQKLNFSETALMGAQHSLDKLKLVFSVKVEGGKVLNSYKRRFLAALNDDLNTPKAMTVVWDLMKSKQSLADKQMTLADFDKVLGLGLRNYKSETIPAEVKKLVKDRELARRQQDWDRADGLRVKIAKLGYVIDDTPQGPRISVSH